MWSLAKLLNTGQFDTVVLLVVASQMMRGQAPQIFFPRTAPVYIVFESYGTLYVSSLCGFMSLTL